MPIKESRNQALSVSLVTPVSNPGLVLKPPITIKSRGVLTQALIRSNYLAFTLGVSLSRQLDVEKAWWVSIDFGALTVTSTLTSIPW